MKFFNFKKAKKDATVVSAEVSEPEKICAYNAHSFSDFLHFTAGSECRCEKCGLTVRFNRASPESSLRVEPDELNAFLVKYRGSRFGFKLPSPTLEKWQHWKNVLPEYFSDESRESILLGFLKENIKVSKADCTIREYSFSKKEGVVYTYLTYMDSGNFFSNKSYDYSPLGKEDFIKLLHSKKETLLREISNDKQAEFEALFGEVLEIICSHYTENC